MAKISHNHSDGHGEVVGYQASHMQYEGSFDPGKERLSYQNMAGKVIQATLDMSQGRACLHNFLENPYYSMCMGLIIIANAILVIHETDLKASDTETPTWVNISSYVFLCIYTIEIGMRLYVYRALFFMSGWNWIDLLVVVTDLCAEATTMWLSADAPSVSVLRIFRLARLLRLLSMLSATSELATMLLGFGAAMRAMVWACFMIGVVLTVCSIIAVEFIHPLNVEVANTGVYGDCRRCSRAFETVAESNLTFIQQIIAGDSWGKITIPIIENYPGAGVFFLLVFGLIDLGVLNLILTVIVNAAEGAREANHEMRLRGKARQIEDMKNKLKSLCSSLDDDHDGRITFQEFMAGVDENEEFATTLALLDVQKQDAELVYKLMDEDGSGDVDFNEFISTMISTKHETEKTKLMFLKAHVNEIQQALAHQERILIEEVVKKMVYNTDLSHVVAKAMDEGAGLQANKIITEFDSFTQKIEYRWDQIQKEQAKSFNRLERLMAEASPYSGAQTPARQSPLSVLGMPYNCQSVERGNAGYGKQSRISSMCPSPRAGTQPGSPSGDPERRAEPAQRSGGIGLNSNR